MPEGKLTFVPTPIGNLGDITIRGIAALREADAIGAEDTRKAKILLERYGIDRPVFAYHVKNERRDAPDIIRQVIDGRKIALITESGMPGISDPGYTLVRMAIEASVPFEVLPGPSAFVPALILSGFPVSGFSFEGFLSHSGKGRRRRLRRLSAERPRTMVFYVSPHRAEAVIRDTLELLGDRRCVICRELTKLHEEIIRGRLSEVVGSVEDVKGELALVVAPD